MSCTLIHNATIVNEGLAFVGSVFIHDEDIALLIHGATEVNQTMKDVAAVFPSIGAESVTVVDGEGQHLLPGVIDEHVHFREPGLTHKSTIASESRKAVLGGVTSFMDMPNCIPQTTTVALVEDKHRIAEGCSPANWSFYLGATSDNFSEIEHLEPSTNCGVKVFMGSSTGGMLLNDKEKLSFIFRNCPFPIALHCEDQDIIAANAARYIAEYGDDPDVRLHPLIRSEEACYRSSACAVELAEKTGANIHILHISTARELSLFRQGTVEEKKITAEACIPHLLYTDADYAHYGTAIKCNPAIKTAADREALREAIRCGLIDTIGTDHAPHTPADKVGGALRAASGIASLPHSLTAMLNLSDEGAFALTDVVRTMCHNPALRYQIDHRGFIRQGWKADLVLVNHTTNGWQVARTWVNGKQVCADGVVDETARGQRLTFNR